MFNQEITAKRHLFVDPSSLAAHDNDWAKYSSYFFFFLKKKEIEKDKEKFFLMTRFITTTTTLIAIPITLSLFTSNLTCYLGCISHCLCHRFRLLLCHLTLDKLHGRPFCLFFCKPSLSIENTINIEWLVESMWVKIGWIKITSNFVHFYKLDQLCINPWISKCFIMSKMIIESVSGCF